MASRIVMAARRPRASRWRSNIPIFRIVGTRRPCPTRLITVASGHGGLVTTSAGLQVMSVALASLDDTPIDTLMAPRGCRGDVYPASAGLVAWVAARGPTVRRLCSICTGQGSGNALAGSSTAPAGVLHVADQARCDADRSVRRTDPASCLPALTGGGTKRLPRALPQQHLRPVMSTAESGAPVCRVGLPQHDGDRRASGCPRPAGIRAPRQAPQDQAKP